MGEFDAVLLKQRTSIYEFWHFDLVDGRDVVYFENILHLISIVTNMVDQVNGYYVSKMINGVKHKVRFEYFRRDDIPQKSPFNAHLLRQEARNGKTFAEQYLAKQSVDCFMINMLKL